jgi:hypothetical protein
LARAKNTCRAEARRRTKDSTRAELATTDAADGDTPDTTDEGTSATAGGARRSLIKMPDVRADLRAVPHMFRARPLLFLPFVLLLVGFGLALILPVLPADVQQWAYLYIQYFFFPQALFTYFIGGFLATRASYLVGLMLGTVTGVLWVVIFVVGVAAGAGPVDAGATGTGPTDVGGASAYVLVTSIILGTIAGGFAGWYRDFLRGMQDRGKQRRADQEAALRGKRRDDRQEARRAAKQRPTS